MYFDKPARTPVPSIAKAAMAISVMCFIAVPLRHRPEFLFGGVGSNFDVIDVLLGMGILFFGFIAWQAAEPHPIFRRRMKELIEQLLDAFECSEHEGDGMTFDTKNNEITVSVIRRAKCVYLVGVKSPEGTRVLMVYRHAVVDGRNTDVPLPPSDLGYFRDLVKFVYGHLDFADRVSASHKSPSTKKVAVGNEQR